MDQAVGYGMVSLAGAIFSYYTIWVIILVSNSFVYVPSKYKTFV